MRRRYFALRTRHTSVVLGASWLVGAPLMLWAVATLYIPIIEPSLSGIETWGVAVGITLMVVISLVSHAMAHAWTAQAAGPDGIEPEVPSSILLFPFGDAAQAWPAAPTPRRDALVAIAGPTANVLLAGLAYLAWDRQLHPYLNVSSIFLAAFNTGLAIVNLAPAFPLDGGRLVRAVAWGLLDRPAQTTHLGVRLGRLMVVALTSWGIVLIAQRARFSLETGAGTLLVAGLLGLALWTQPAWEWNRPVHPHRSSPSGSAIRGLIAVVLFLGLLGAACSLVPTNNGLEAPGIATAVEPMVAVSPEYRHSVAGSFILTTVFPQAPITAGQWAYGQLSPVVKIVPPERIVPRDTTPQELAEQGNRMLEESETIATAVALRLAGYDVEVVGEAAEVVSILPESPANEALQPGDRIIGLNGESIRLASELAERIRAQSPHAKVDLLVERAGQEMRMTLPLMQPSSPDEPPRLGIIVQTIGLDVVLPFQVEVEPQKIAGGPSAGLMFTLTIYNIITPEDLTGGRRIAGTGTIDLDGKVGPIGGVGLKVASAERAGAEYFLVPTQNYQDARQVARRIKVVKITTAQAAVDFLRSLPASVISDQ
ncbi:MAG: site-2 protease family protein [Anaerolineae bacterium]